MTTPQKGVALNCGYRPRMKGETACLQSFKLLPLAKHTVWSKKLMRYHPKAVALTS